MPLHINTPLLQSRALSILSGKSVLLKLDALQPSGSFKLRGVGAVCERFAQQGKSTFVSSSGGNAGIAVAYAGRQLSIPVTVVVPESTTALAKKLIAQEGAKVIVHGSSWMEANALAQSMLEDPSVAFVHPFDDSFMWSGHASMIDEVVAANAHFDCVVLSVGGGGLLSGVMEGLLRNGLAHIPVVAIETQGADSLARSVSAGHLIELEAITSIATSLGAKKVCANAFELTTKHDIRCHTISDLEAVNACEQFLTDHRLLVEPACGASLAAVYEHSHDVLADFQAPLVIVCGGATADLARIQNWKKQLSN